ncbi:D-serine deaminase-like pyridoxal phosphate-dependent protein [Thermosporothrix hazakensis]|jgi:D-serine deaminase-like pyridoxal phosphate-dependent protein|uniref:D-serine deaminase-like pyridoxal phosphate-dependent protein n=2 Tax=Thermosporothrix TaxID=768650 RepID=A0A326UHP9_THEHA|nr:amino acid deaminase/aldolase [Thermosporothrix hazakensis]PZW27470.1 D-serine deaminase-like pyridoxal phosphate-dependent protein [Thermosporothrix hazakensis]BBH85937.1 amino acid aldolase [Thermosporothrix sp. COM3]GCE45636.1 amino acid aldolase [Thermosporothrix hazakensis]
MRERPLTRSYAYYREIFQGQRMPFAFVDLDLFDRNVRTALRRARGKQVRIGTKSVRSVALLRRLLEQGCQGCLCFTAREAAYLASQGFDDLVIAYPVWHRDDIAEVAQAVKGGARITLMVDSVEHVRQAASVAEQQETQLSLCLDLDMSSSFPGLHFGSWRSPLRTPEQVRPVLDAIKNAPTVTLDGVMGYEAQIAGVGDATPGQALKNALIRTLKQRSIAEVARRRQELVSFVEGYYGRPLRFVNGGGTGSIETTCAEECVTEVTVGSAFYAPALFDAFHSFRYLPAAGYAIEIVRRPAPTLYTCLGGGYVASGAVGADKWPRPYLPRGARFDSLEGAGEVQTPIFYKGPLPLRLGDPIFLRHAKAGELCERFTHLLLVSEGQIVETVTTYRGDGQNFL